MPYHVPKEKSNTDYQARREAVQQVLTVIDANVKDIAGRIGNGERMKSVAESFNLPAGTFRNIVVRAGITKKNIQDTGIDEAIQEYWDYRKGVTKVKRTGRRSTQVKSEGGLFSFNCAICNKLVYTPYINQYAYRIKYQQGGQSYAMYTCGYNCLNKLKQQVNKD